LISPLFLLFFFAGFSLFAVNSPVEDFFPHGGFVADFREIVSNPALGMKKTFTGRVFYKKPYSIRMEVFSPDTELIVTNGIKGWWVLPGEGRVQESEVTDLKESLPFQFLSGKRDTLWMIEKIKENEVDTYTFVPIRENPFKDTIRIEMKSGLPTHLEIRKASGEVLKFWFYNVKPEEELFDSLFFYKGEGNGDE